MRGKLGIVITVVVLVMSAGAGAFAKDHKSGGGQSGGGGGGGQSGGGSQSVTLCHNGSSTITVSGGSVNEHLGHGDTRGACSGGAGSSSSDSGTDGTGGGGGGGTPAFILETGGWQQISLCLPDCTGATVRSPNTIGTLLGGEGVVMELISILSPDEYDLECSAFEGQSDVVVFDVRGTADAEKWIAVTLLDYSGDPAVLDACFGGEATFTEQDGTSSSYNGDYHVGVLPDCGLERPPWWSDLVDSDSQPPSAPSPCVVSREFDDEAGGATLFVAVPPGDPVIRIG